MSLKFEKYIKSKKVDDKLNELVTSDKLIEAIEKEMELPPVVTGQGSYLKPYTPKLK